MIVRKLFFCFVSCIFCLTSLGQTKELLISGDSLPYTLKTNWKYSTEDNNSFSSPIFNDNTWKTIIPSLRTDALNDTIFNGFAWFRLHIFIPRTLINKSLALSISHAGASEIFIDGQKVASYGKVTYTGDGEERFNPSGVALPTIFRDSSRHLIAVRYANHKFKQYEFWDDFTAGFRLELDYDKNQTFTHYNHLFKINIILLCVGGFLFALTFIHVFFYAFYRKQKHHLYYSFFTFFFALFFFLPYFSLNLNDPDIIEPLGYFIPMVVPVYFISLAGFTYYLILQKLPRTFWLSILVGLVILSGFIFQTGFNDIFYAVLIFLVIAQSNKALSEGEKMKLEGIAIIRWGFRIFLIFLSFIGVVYFITVTGILKGGFTINQNTIYFLLPGILSIPVSISMYMARNFAAINISLEKKLAEVEELSAKSIEQEKEKQQILAQQNILLEQKVKERTAEVVAQKELVETKQKEILDSIRYAKRIQMALLPSDKYIDRVLKLFKKE